MRCRPEVSKVRKPTAHATHDAPRAHDPKVGHGVGLLAKARELRFLLNAKPLAGRTGEVQGDYLAPEGPEDDIEGDEDEVEVALGVARVVRRRVRDAMRDKKERCEGVG